MQLRTSWRSIIPTIASFSMTGSRLMSYFTIISAADLMSSSGPAVMTGVVMRLSTVVVVSDEVRHLPSLRRSRREIIPITFFFLITGKAEYPVSMIRAWIRWTVSSAEQVMTFLV